MSTTSSSCTLDIPQDKNQLVEILLKKQDLYEILHVTRQATTEIIIKQYKKLSILVHPDRNSHPKSSDAFKKLGEAKGILSVETSRRRYDLTGSTSDRAPHPGYTYSTDPFFSSMGSRRRRAGQFDEFDAFANAFGFMFEQGNSRNHYYYSTGSPFSARPRTSRHQQESFGTFSWIIPVGFLLFIVYSMWNFNAQSEKPEFTLWKTDSHTVQWKTLNGIAFWLEPGKFSSSSLLDNKFRSDLYSRVQAAYLSMKRSECSHDLKQQGSGSKTRPRSCQEYDKFSRSP